MERDNEEATGQETKVWARVKNTLKSTVECPPDSLVPRYKMSPEPE